MKNVYLTLIIWVFFFAQLSAQQDNAGLGEKQIAGGNYFAAAQSFEKATAEHPEKPELWLRLGYCYLELPGEHEAAVDKLEKAVELSKDSKDKYLSLDCRYTLARAYHCAYRFDDAIRTFNELVADSEIAKYQAFEDIEYEIEKAKNAKLLIDSKTEIRIVRAKGSVNSDATDHSPFLVCENLYFTSKRKPNSNGISDFDGQYNEKIYISQTTNPEVAVQMDAPISSEASDAVCWVSEDESLMLFYRKETIWLGKKENGTFLEPKPIKALKSNYREPDAAMSQDGNTIIFASDRPGGIGGLDLYKITKSGEDEWSKPVNLGAQINSPYDDNSPYIHDDGTLYFASRGHNSMGEYDIFYATSDNGNYSEAVNMGFPTNSVANDTHYFLSKDKAQAYFTSSRVGSLGYSDIYYINYADSSLKYLVVEADINTSGASPENVNLKIQNVTDDKAGYQGNLNASKRMELGVQRGKDYYAEVTSKGYFPEAFVFTAPTDTTRKRELSSRKLDTIKYEDVTKNYKVGFDKGSDEINENTTLFLNTITEFHKENPEFVIDVTVPDEGNGKRNKKRTQTVVDYLTKNGIPEEKISVNLIDYKGKDGDALLTIMDEGTRKKAYVADIDETGNTTPTTNKTGDGSYDNTKPDAGNVVGTGEYVIQILAAKRIITKSDPFFKKCRCNVTIVKGKDGLNRYMFGNYKYQADAEENLKIIVRKGYGDAFIRPSDWYKAN